MFCLLPEGRRFSGLEVNASISTGYRICWRYQPRATPFSGIGSTNPRALKFALDRASSKLRQLPGYPTNTTT